MVYPFSIDVLVIVLFLGLLSTAAVFDVREYRIPNRLCLAIAALYPFHVLASPRPVDWAAALAVALMVLFTCAALFMVRAIGGGDAKLIAATALWAGPSGIFEFLMVTTFAGGLIGLAMMTPLRYGLAGRPAGAAPLKQVIPYGLPIAAGGCLVGLRLLGWG